MIKPKCVTIYLLTAALAVAYRPAMSCGIVLHPGETYQDVQLRSAWAEVGPAPNVCVIIVEQGTLEEVDPVAAGPTRPPLRLKAMATSTETIKGVCPQGRVFYDLMMTSCSLGRPPAGQPLLAAFDQDRHIRWWTRNPHAAVGAELLEKLAEAPR